MPQYIANQITYEDTVNNEKLSNMELIKHHNAMKSRKETAQSQNILRGKKGSVKNSHGKKIQFNSPSGKTRSPPPGLPLAVQRHQH